MREKGSSVKSKIVAALVELMKVKPYDRITITDITNEAHVSRMAYYRNYTSKEDILVKFMDEVGENIHKQLVDIEGKDRVRVYFTSLFTALGQHSDVGVSVLNAQRGELILRNINKQMLLTFGKENMSRTRQYRIYFIAGAFFNVFVQWIQNGCEETPRDMADIGCNMLAEELYLLG